MARDSRCIVRAAALAVLVVLLVIPPDLAKASELLAHPSVSHSYARLPLSFEENRGQTDARVKFLARGRGYSLFLTGDAAVLSLSLPPSAPPRRPSNSMGTSSARSASFAVNLSLQLLSAKRNSRVSGEQELPGKMNYFIGDNPRKWRANVPSYARVRYHEVYPGIDLIYYGNPQQLEYDFVISPGADPKAIRLKVAGAEKLALDGQGGLVLHARGHEIRLNEPRLYQKTQGLETKITGRYRLGRRHEIVFEVGGYDRNKPLVIDPVLSYSTFLGGSSLENANGIAVDAAGSAYVTGTTGSADFPLANAFRGGPLVLAAFLSKLTPSGAALVYSTYLGGNSDTFGKGIGVDAMGNAYVTGSTLATDFPTTPGPFQTFAPGSYCFVTKFNPTGSLVYSNIIPNADCKSVAVDPGGNAYVTGGAGLNLPTTAGAFQPTFGAGPVFKSTDAGSNWTPVNKGLSGQVSVLVVDPKAPSTLYANAAGGVFKSTDGGATWIPSSTGLPQGFGVTALVIDPITPSTLYAGGGAKGSNTVFKSTDGGNTWSASNSGLPSNPVTQPFAILAIDPQTPSTLYAVLNRGGPFGEFNIGTFKSTDAGNTWALGNPGLPPNVFPGALTIDPVTPSTIYFSQLNQPSLFKSTDGGNTWVGLAAAPSGNIAIDPKTPATIYAGTSDGVSKSTDGGNTWSSARSLLPGTCGATRLLIDPITPTTLYAAGCNGGIFKSTDAGANWSPTGLTATPPAFGGGLALLLDPGTPTTLYAGTGVGGNAFVVKLDPSGSALVYSTYLGGSFRDGASSIAVDSAGNAYVTGSTSFVDPGSGAKSLNFPTTPGALQTGTGGIGFPFLTKLNAAGSALVYSTTAVGGAAIGVAAGGNAYLTGVANSSFVATPGAFQTGPGDLLEGDAFVVKVNPSGSALVYATYLGGRFSDSGLGIAVDGSGNAYVIGATNSPDFPTKNPVQTSCVGRFIGSPLFSYRSTAFITKLNPSGSALAYSTCLGGSDGDRGLSVAVDAAGNAYVTGGTRSANFPTASPFQATYGGPQLDPLVLTFLDGDAFVAKISDRLEPTPSLPPNSVVNAASFQPATQPNQAVAPGSIVAIFGTDLAGATQPAGILPLPLTLMDTSVTFNNISAPLFFVSSPQVNAQVPFEVGTGMASVQVKRGSGASTMQSVSVASVSPGVFTTNSAGTGQGAILIGNTPTVAAPTGSLPGRDARPVARGEFISIYCTGLGDVKNRPPTGAPASSNPLSATLLTPTVTIGGAPATIAFSGLAPFFVGLGQVNVQVPDGAPSGDAVAVALTIAGVSANTATIAIQ